MKVEISVKVEGQVVKQFVEDVSGTLEQMEETIDALGRRVCGEALQATVDGVAAPRPLFRKTAASGDIKATKRVRSSE